ncbi:hypothetical protein RHMOL_Rhmol10G0127800 [Rhododendron molle]|uniref:Uncharacterized protein n=4 Tax=Rhododendron molle TaxID=49168 RepID=A0ACC0M1Q9_RHOML|nr:hypothetical protein RHMOL_Rhmol10G0127800 [Rhododendron molle]KAI8534840.1 hypothetical protein RHMOL_Rhmol10G0127800 [Rhododendron molle]KAI8534841.1 hypothetical protein RHMOL_Rhmol10G0127800 [Rhododendron molle]KAI8534842.1 hypothetical protein RHMOL_Rhmol10G0127800 [Rhododendron molle]
MMAEEEEIGVAIEIEPVEQSWLHIPDLMKDFEFEDFMNLGSSYDKKAREIDEGDNGSVDEVEVAVSQCGMIFDTADEAYNFYNGYARKIGFSVRKQRTNKNVSSLTEVRLLELEAKVESWISSRCANQNVASNAQNSSTLNVDDEAPLRDPTKRQRRCQGGKGENSTTKAMTRSKDSKPLKEVEENENAHDTTSTQGPHVEQPNMAATVGMNALQVPDSSCTGKPSTFTEMLLDGYEV